MRQIDRLIATLDTRNNLEPKALVAIRPPERLPRSRSVCGVADHERDLIAMQHIPATERGMLVRLPAALSHRDRPRMRKPRIHMTPVAREVCGYQRARVAALRKGLHSRGEDVRSHSYRRGSGQC